MKKQKFEDWILWNDGQIIVVNKPPGIATLHERDSTRDAILLLGREAFGENLRACHRLDKETSGCLVLALSEEAYRHISIQFERRTIKKTYHAIIDGIHNYEQRRVTMPIAVSGRGNVRIDTAEGKPAETIFNTLQVFDRHTLVECLPVTGRMHQIRIHLAFLRTPICADILYGGKFTYLSDLKRRFNLKKLTEEEALMKRVALHAFAITFQDMEGNEVSVEAPYPKDFRAFITQLEKAR